MERNSEGERSWSRRHMQHSRPGIHLSGRLARQIRLNRSSQQHRRSYCRMQGQRKNNRIQQ